MHFDFKNSNDGYTKTRIGKLIFNAQICVGDKMMLLINAQPKRREKLSPNSETTSKILKRSRKLFINRTHSFLDLVISTHPTQYK